MKTIAVYSDANANSQQVNLAEEAILIGTGPARDSYLLSARIISVSEQNQADAIHPGYGFLSENADFAELVTNSGFTWIGLKSATIRSMGDKNRARKFAEKARIQILPGNERLDKIDLGYIEELASKIRLPLVV